MFGCHCKFKHGGIPGIFGLDGGIKYTETFSSISEMWETKALVAIYKT
jgi:hypothetical protein